MPDHVKQIEKDFWNFVAKVPVASRDHGILYISRPWGTQKYIIRQILDGQARGVRQHLVHKGRQVGASLVLMLWTAYLLFKHPGLQGACITDDDENREYFRDVFTQMALAAPGAPVLRVKNKNQLAWDNGSRLLYQFAGIRERRRQKLGVGRGLAFLHATEAPLWVSAAIMAYLRSAFSKEHEARCYVFEGTPRGRNAWYDLWTEAHTNPKLEAQALFAAWWLREDYAFPKSSAEFKKYWDHRFTTPERRWQRELERRYHTTLRPEQIAWRRWYLAEHAEGDARLADQEMATLPEEGFEASGQSFLAVEAVRRCRRAVAAAPTPQHWRYEFGPHIEETRLKRTVPAHGDLAIWEEPQAVAGYVIAAVPAFSSNATCPTHVVSVWRASRDELVQVAEFASEECGMQPFAWVCAHLLGAYGAPRRAFIIETLGLGGGVFQELKRLQASGWGTTRRPQLSDMIGGIRHYIWRRPDSMSGAAALQWRSSPDYRSWAFNRLRDQLANGAVILRSEACQRELERIRQVGDEFIPEGRDAEEHRVFAAALAVESWASQLKPVFERVQGASTATTVTERMVEGFFDRLRAQPAGTRR